MQNTRTRPPPGLQKDLAKQITELSYRHSHWQAFADFVEMGAIAISNAVDLRSRDTREKRYMEVIGRYKPDEAAKFPHMLGTLTMALEEETSDVLGATFHHLELHNKWSGQFFSPYPLCRMMAKMIVGGREEVEARIAERGYLTALEPACGSGVLIKRLYLHPLPPSRRYSMSEPDHDPNERPRDRFELCPVPTARLSERGDIYRSYSADLIATAERVRAPFHHQGQIWVSVCIPGCAVTRSGFKEFEAYRLTPSSL